VTTFLLTFLVILAAGVVVEGYFVLGNQQRMRTTNEQILAANVRLLALHPSKSADRTTAPDDAPAFVPYVGLRELDRWADDGGPEPITDRIPVVPATEPMQRVDVVGGARITERPVPHKRGRHAA